MDYPEELTSMLHVLNKLKREGFEEDFQISDRGMTIKDKGLYFNPEDLTIIKTYRFEGASNPDDMAIIYQIESKDGHKGVYIDAFGTYADQDPIKAAEFLKEIKSVEHH